MTDNNETLHPGRILLTQAMEPLGISRNQLARDIDVPVGRISDITNGKRGVTADTALRLGRYFGTGPELWLRLQAEYELYVACKTTWPAVESRVRILSTQAPPAAVEAPAPAPASAPVESFSVEPVVAAPMEVPDTPPVLSPVITPEQLPTDDASLPQDLAAEAEDETEPFAENMPEQLADPVEVVLDSDPSPNTAVAEPVQKPDKLDGGEDHTEDQSDDSVGDEEPLDLSQALIVESDHGVEGVEDPVPGTDLQDPVFEPGLANDQEEDLGIPPMPDQSKVFVSG